LIIKLLGKQTSKNLLYFLDCTEIMITFAVHFIFGINIICYVLYADAFVVGDIQVIGNRIVFGESYAAI
jgi:hypothetical protein